MQERHLDRLRYLKGIGQYIKGIYIDYVDSFFSLKSGCRILEGGCGEGGNLLPFARKELR
jgi:hypothetical protein